MWWADFLSAEETLRELDPRPSPFSCVMGASLPIASMIRGGYTIHADLVVSAMAFGWDWL
jgi:hypothetical protein